MRLLLIFIFLGGICSARAQNIQTSSLAWSSAQTTNVSTNETFEHTCTFITRTDNTIDWVQKGGAKVYRYTVTERNGSWTDVAEEGGITYSVTGYGNGTITFQRVDDRVTVEVVLTNDESTTTHYRFFISSINLQ